MPTTREVVDAYGASWNEPDEAKRRELLDMSWADGGVFQDPRDRAEGRDALLQLIAGFQQQFAGAQILMTSGLDEHHGLIRFTWKLDTADGATLIEGIDFGELAPDGRIQRIAGFWGPPAPLSS